MAPASPLGHTASMDTTNLPFVRSVIMQISITAAKKQLSTLTQKAMGGEEVVITKHGKPIVRLTPCMQPKGLEQLLGCMKGEIVASEGWDAPLDEHELDAFYKGNIG